MATFRGVGVRQTSAGIGTQPAEARKSLAGLLVPSSALGAREGILAAPGNPLRVSGTASWQYSVSAGHVASSRSDADGSVVFGLDGTTLTTAVSAAPGSGSRYDLIYLLQHDLDAGDADANAVLGVVEGVASGSPVRPSIPAGAVTIAESVVSAGATSTQHANVTITQVLGKTVARGGIVPTASQADRDTLVGYEGLYNDRADLDTLERYNGTAWVPVAGRTCEATVTLGPTDVPPSTLAALGPVIASEVGGDFSVSTFTVFVPVAGVYVIAPRVSIVSDPTGRCFVNVVVAGVTHRVSSPFEAITAGTVTARLAAGAGVKIEYFHTAASTQSVTGAVLIARLTP